MTKVNLYTPVRVRGTLVGWIGQTEDGETCYASHRERQEHYYRKVGGYAVSQVVLDHLTERNINRVFIVETDTKRVYEYALQTLLDGVPINHDGHDEQRCATTNHADTHLSPDDMTVEVISGSA